MNLSERYLNKVFQMIEKAEILIPPHSLGIPRSQMPQIEDDCMDAFIAHLKKNGVSVRKANVKVKTLKATQKELNADTVKNLLKQNPDKLKKPIFVSSDNYILDGHHRWLALYNFDEESSIPAYICSSDIRKLLQIAKTFDQVAHRDVHNQGCKV